MAVYAQTGRQLPLGLLHTILERRFCTGFVHFRNRVFKGVHTPLVSTTTLQRVQEIQRRREQADADHSDIHPRDGR